MNYSVTKVTAQQNSNRFFFFDIALLLLFLMLLFLTYRYRESAAGHVRVQLQDRVDVAVRHLVQDAGNRQPSGGDAEQQAWWYDSLGQIMNADSVLTALTVFDAEGKIVAKSFERMRQSQLTFQSTIMSGYNVSVVVDGEALAKIRAEFSLIMRLEGIVALLYLLIRLAQGNFLRYGRRNAGEAGEKTPASSGWEGKKAGLVWKKREKERAFLARELHERFSQSLSAVLIRLGMLPAGPVDGNGQLAEVRQELADNIFAINSLARRLWPAVLDDLGLQAALRSLVRDYRQAAGLEIELEFEQGKEPAASIPKDIELLIYRFVEEGLKNISKHAAAGWAGIHLCVCSSVLQIVISDDGVGFEAENVWLSSDAGGGLLELRDVLTVYNGVLQIKSAPGQGTIITARIPLADQAGGRRPVHGPYSCAIGG